ncbi:hypothetical protein F5I97DRAFT_97692 [Phlebopus sp. FC_14]|nr:hypothetical protein F5I97DRAFT_97692 [Phlebopus sp. FC_14]
MPSIPSMPRFRTTHHSLSHFPFKFGSKCTRRTGYFPPGGRTDHHPDIPLEHLCISLSDPVLVAVEEKLRGIARRKERERTQCPAACDTTAAEKLDVRGQVGLSTVPPATATAMTKVYSDNSDCVARNRIGARDAHAPSLLTVNSGQETKYLRRWWLLVVPTCLRDPSIDDVARYPALFSLDANLREANMATLLVDSLTSSGDNTNEERTCVPNLAPLASQMFKEELYRRRYLKRPTPRMTTAPYRPNAGTVLTSIQVLGRQEGRVAVECLKAMQDPITLPGENEHSTYYSCESIPISSIHALESPDRLGDSALSTSATTFDLDEFSYITAYTAPSASPDVEESLSGHLFTPLRRTVFRV